MHTGIDDARLEQLQTELDMMKISQDADRVPIWLKCNKSMVPDFVAADPKVRICTYCIACCFVVDGNIQVCTGKEKLISLL